MPVPDAALLTRADAFLGELNGKLSEWGVGITAKRRYSVQYDIKTLATLQVDVQVLTLDADIEDKVNVVFEYGFNVVVQQKVDPTDTPTIDRLLKIIAAIFDHWKQEDHIGDLENTHLTERDVMPYAPTMLDAKSIFFGTAAFVFEETR